MHRNWEGNIFFPFLTEEENLDLCHSSLNTVCMQESTLLNFVLFFLSSKLKNKVNNKPGN